MFVVVVLLFVAAPVVVLPLVVLSLLVAFPETADWPVRLNAAMFVVLLTLVVVLVWLATTLFEPEPVVSMLPVSLDELVPVCIIGVVFVTATVVLVALPFAAAPVPVPPAVVLFVVVAAPVVAVCNVKLPVNRFA